MRTGCLSPPHGALLITTVFMCLKRNHFLVMKTDSEVQLHQLIYTKQNVYTPYIYMFVDGIAAVAVCLETAVIYTFQNFDFILTTMFCFAFFLMAP